MSNDHLFLLINKPIGITSHDVVDVMRNVTGVRKIGHAGTLDPFAGGLLILAIGREATKNLGAFVKLDKEYIADIELGISTDTQDRTGNVIAQSDVKPTRKQVEKVLREFQGEQKQTPPMFSAKKHKGKKLYELARRGIQIERPLAEITIHELELISYTYPILRVRIHCTSGTYIRTLANDIGVKLGTYAHAKELTRTKIGAFDLKDAHNVVDITKENWQKMGLSDIQTRF